MDLFGGVISLHGITYLLFCVFVIAAAGYCIGRVTVKGVSLGTAGVFLASLVFGSLFFGTLEKENGAFTKDALKIVENIGLVMFVTSVGFIAGPGFIANIRKNLRSYVILSAIIILSGGAAAVLCILIGRSAGIEESRKLTAMIAGLFSGAMTSTPAFSAAKASVEAAYEDIVSVGYGIAYIFGVVGVVLFVQIIPKIERADIADELKKLSYAREGSKKGINFDELIHMDPFGVMPFSLAIVLGIIAGMIRIPLSASGLSGTCFSLTTTGGCLMSSLFLGHFGKCGRISLMPYHSSLKVFREFGLALFLIGAGLSAGAQFVRNFRIIYFVFGVVITTVPMITGYLFAVKLLRMNLLDALSAITGGMTSTPALGTLIGVAGTEEIAFGYAAAYPAALITVVLVTQFIIILF